MTGEPLVPQRLLFRFAVPCFYHEPIWTDQGVGLGERCRLPALAELEGKRVWADFRLAWSERGLAFTLLVRGKRQAPWCRVSRLEDSDGVQLWIDTRDVHNVHRATRFCHRFAFLPAGAGRRLDEPMVHRLPIAHARANPRPARPEMLAVRREMRIDGYTLEGWIGAEALAGFDPVEQPRLGFNYAVLDRELGEQTLSAGSPLPYQEDPSLWATLELVR